MTISVRLSKQIETKLRKDSEKQGTNISDIVNEALEKYYDKYQYFDSINAHHLDPIVVGAFFSLVDSPEKINMMSDAGSKMIKKYIMFFSNGDDSIKYKIELISKFLSFNSVKTTQANDTNKIIFSGIHQHGKLYSQIITQIIQKILTNVEIINQDEGSFKVIINKKMNFNL